MANGICDVCNVRPATVRARVSSNGQSEILELCDVDYRRLARQQRRTSSPLESLFGGRGSPFEDFFNDDFFASRSGEREDFPPEPGFVRDGDGAEDFGKRRLALAAPGRERRGTGWRIVHGN